MLLDKHVHEFQRIGVNINGKKEWRWKCLHPDCHAVFPRYKVSGKRTICAVCHQNTLILDNLALAMAKPRCEYCSNTKENIAKRAEISAAQDLLNQVLVERKILEDKTEDEIFHEDFLSGMYKDD